MFAIVSLLFAACAAAEVTTSIWMPSGYGNDEIGFYGSVIGSDGDRITLAVIFDDDTDTSDIGVYTNTPETITVASTYFESFVTTSDIYDDSALTVSLACSKGSGSRARPTCTYSMGGEAIYSSWCADYSTYTDVVTSTYVRSYSADEYGPATVVTYTETEDYRDYIPSYCSSGSEIPEEYLVSTFTLPRSSVESFQVVITAGEEKLSASAGAVPTGTNAQVTGTDGKPTGTGAQPTGAGANSSPTGTGAAAAAGTGAAAPMITMAPALAGLGAAVAALVL